MLLGTEVRYGTSSLLYACGFPSFHLSRGEGGGEKDWKFGAGGGGLAIGFTSQISPVLSVVVPRAVRSVYRG